MRAVAAAGLSALLTLLAPAHMRTASPTSSNVDSGMEMPPEAPHATPPPPRIHGVPAETVRQ